MPKFYVAWTKGYYMSGIAEVEADHEDDAHDRVLENIGNYTGSLQYDENGETVEVIKKVNANGN